MAAVEPQIAVIGAGYVGLPLAAELAEAGRPVVLVDVDADRVARINLGQSYIADVPSERLRALVERGAVRGTTSDQLKPILERVSGLRAGIDFNLAMAPERIDPGNRTHTIRTVPKVVGGLTAACTERAMALYAPAIDSLVA